MTETTNLLPALRLETADLSLLRSAAITICCLPCRFLCFLPSGKSSV